MASEETFTNFINTFRRGPNSEDTTPDESVDNPRLMGHGACNGIGSLYRSLLRGSGSLSPNSRDRAEIERMINQRVNKALDRRFERDHLDSYIGDQRRSRGNYELRSFSENRPFGVNPQPFGDRRNDAQFGYTASSPTR